MKLLSLLLSFLLLAVQPAQAVVMVGFGQSAASYSDDFASDNNPLPSPWAEPTFGAANPIKSLSGTARATVDSTQNLAYYSTWAGGANQCSSVKYVALGTAVAGPAVRMQTDTDTFYWFSGGGSSGFIKKRISGTETTIYSDSSLGTTTNDVWKMCVSGTSPNVSISMYKNGSSTATHTVNSLNDSIDSGYPGMRITTTGVQLDDWVGSTP